MDQPQLKPRDGGWAIVLDNGEIPVDAIVVTTPSPVLARLVPNLPELYRAKLSGLEYEAAVVALLQLSHPLSDIYWLNVADDDLPFTGVIEHTNFISPEEYGGKRFVYLSKYLEPDHPYFAMPDDQLIDAYVPFLKRINPEFDRVLDRTILGLSRTIGPTDHSPQLQPADPRSSHRTARISTWPTRPRFIPKTAARTTACASAITLPRSSPKTSLTNPSEIDGGPTMTPARIPRLELEDIVSTYQEGSQHLTALDGLSLTVGQAEFVALVGPSGSGKSTLLDIVAGLITQDSGTVRLDGESTTAKQRLGQSAYMQQRDLLLPWRTTTGNAALGLEASGMSRSDCRAEGGRGALAFWSRWLWQLPIRPSFQAACASARLFCAPSCRARSSSCSTNPSARSMP